MALLHWKIGAVGAYLDPANWVEGIAPALGDTTIIADPSGPNFYPAGIDVSFLSTIGQPAPPGNAIVGQTIDFTPGMASTTTPQLSNTTFAVGTTINVTGPGTQSILAWFENTFQGVVNIGDAINSGRLGLTLVHQPTGLPPALATNAGFIAIAANSVFHISPFLFRGGPFYDGVANFDNKGLIDIAPGGELVESQSTLMDLGPYPWTFNNDGAIRVRGGGNQSTLAVLETDVTGNGSVSLSGGTSTDPVWTQLRITGDIAGGGFDLRNASIVIGDVLGSTLNTGGAITFSDSNCFALLEPPFDPFGIPITGFRAGDTIALAHQSTGFFGSTYSYAWNQPAQQLTIFETPNASATFELARLTLNGTYGPNDFTLIDNTGVPMVPGAVSINNGGTFTTPFQLDITTIAIPPPTPNFVFGTIAADLIYGLGDRDPRLAYDEIFYGNGGADIIYAGGGNDWVWASTADNSNITFFGQDGNDVLVGFGGNDWLQGDGGDDTLIGGAGADTVLGGAGNDSLWGGAGDDSLQGGDGGDVLVGGLAGEPGNDWLSGDAGDDILIGGDGGNTLIGGDGDDQLWSSSAGNALNAGSGADLVVSVPATAGGAFIDPGFDAARDQIILEGDGTKQQDVVTSGQSALQTLAGADIIWNFLAPGDRLLLRAGDHTGVLESSVNTFAEFGGLSGTLLTNGGAAVVFLAGTNTTAAALMANGALVFL